jgi:hypothetical protein
MDGLEELFAGFQGGGQMEFVPLLCRARMEEQYQTHDHRFCKGIVLDLQRNAYMSQSLNIIVSSPV